jgi:hypothetical protein
MMHLICCREHRPPSGDVDEMIFGDDAITVSDR